MHLAILGPLTLALSSIVSATCYRSGEASSPNLRNALTENNNERLREVCRGMVVNREFGPGQSARGCTVAWDRLRRWEFIVERISRDPPSLRVDLEDCVQKLRLEVVGCTRGGIRDYPHFRFGYVESQHSLQPRTNLLDRSDLESGRYC